MYKIPVSQPSITTLELNYAKDALNSGWISSKGPYIERFENAWASYNKCSYGVACNSGTSALLLALRALGIKEGDEVIVPDFTMIACAWAVTYCGAKPVFVDCKDDLTIDTHLIERAITPNTKAIMAVHIYGRRCDMKSIMRIAYEYNLRVIEDLAEAHGIIPVSDIGCYSFYGNKILTTGEGGMCITNDQRLHDQMKHLRSMAFSDDHNFLHKKIGYNLRMTNVQAAIGCAQVERIDEILEERRKIESLYNKYLKEKYKMPKRDVVWMYDIQTFNIEGIKLELEYEGIETRYFFKPMTLQPMYKGEVGKNSLKWSKRGIYLPTYVGITEKEIKEICNIINT